MPPLRSKASRVARSATYLALLAPSPTTAAEEARVLAEPAPLPEDARPAKATDGAAAEPFRVSEAVGVPWLRFGLEQRVRFEQLWNDFRVANAGDATGLFTRTLLSAEARSEPLVLGFELSDSRAWATEATPLNTTMVDTFVLLQGYVGLRARSALAEGDLAAMTAGRLTLDVGSRRLVARNEFRNTINGFTGVDLQWTSPDADLFRSFVVLPVVRLPSDAAAVSDNDYELDRENTSALFWGGYFQSRPLGPDIQIEAYLLGLQEGDSDVAPSANRQLFTPGVRALRSPAPARVDFQIEAMGQFGTSRATTAPDDTTDLTALAFSLHASGGYRFALSWAPRVVLQYDYATGDGSPDDDRNGRFDPLFGARRFEFGPTGLYGAFGRSNVNSPGFRFEVQPHALLDAFAAFRVFWLASARDAWPAAGLRDPTGDSGSFVGEQLEARVRFHPLPKNLTIEGGGALLLRGAFAREAPGGEDAPAVYLYAQVVGAI